MSHYRRLAVRLTRWLGYSDHVDRGKDNSKLDISSVMQREEVSQRVARLLELNADLRQQREAAKK